MKKILVTGGCGYIGSHTIVDLLSKGFDVISVDNFSHSDKRVIEGIQKAANKNKNIINYEIDLCDIVALEDVFNKNRDIVGIVHFAAYKSVNESVDRPLMYFRNNLNSLINILDCAIKYDVPNFIFSSSCSVYGNADILPVNENTPMSEPESPYGRTKQMGEKIILDTAAVNENIKFIILRYFNPVGAHQSGEIGEWPIGKHSNLFPVICYSALDDSEITVHGGDHDTEDGSCVRDYVHVMDIAEAHSLSLMYLSDRKNMAPEVLNLGSGYGHSVFDVIRAFERTTGIKLKYKIGPQRHGDIAAIFSDNKKAVDLLKWNGLRGLDEMILSAWNWTKCAKYI